MKTARHFVPGLTLLVSAIACMAAEEPGSSTAVRIRIANISEVPYSDVTIRFPRQTEDYGDLAPGAISEYRDVEVAYKYASVTLTANGRMHRALAADYLGETKLEPGAYTYTLDLDRGSPRFGLRVDEE